MVHSQRGSTGHHGQVSSESPLSLSDVVAALKHRNAPSVTVIEWWPSSRKRRWHHRTVGRAWIVSDVAIGANGTERPGTALGSDGHLHGFLWKSHLTRRRGMLTRWMRTPKRVRASKLFPDGAVQYVPVAKWESNDDLIEFCRRNGLDVSGPMIDA